MAKFAVNDVFISTEFNNAFIVKSIVEAIKVSNDGDRKITNGADYKVNYMMSRYPDVYVDSLGFEHKRETIKMWEHDIMRLINFNRLKKAE